MFEKYYNTFKPLFIRLFTIVIIFLLLFCVLFCFKKVGIDLISSIKNFMLNTYLGIAQIFLKLFGRNVVLNYNNENIIFCHNQLYILKDVILGIRYFIIAFLIILVTADNYTKVLKYCLIISFIIPISSSLLLALGYHFDNFIDTQAKFSLIFESFIILFLICFIYWQRKKNILQINKSSIFQLGESLRLSYFIGIGLFAIWTQVVLYYSFIKEYLANIILYSSKYILQIICYSPQIKERCIIGNNVCIYIGNPCLGINILLVFTFIMLIFKGKLLSKISYLFIGIFLIVFLNILRIVGLYIFVNKNGGVYNGKINTHDLYNYPVYIVVLLIWILYLMKFQKKSKVININNKS